MTTSYPSSLDSWAAESGSNKLNSSGTGGKTHADIHTDTADAIEALEAKLGADSSSVKSSMDYRHNKNLVFLDDYCTGDGVADDSDGFDAAFTAMRHDGYTLLFTPGKRYRITRKIEYICTASYGGGLGFTARWPVHGFMSQSNVSNYALPGAYVWCDGPDAGLYLDASGALLKGRDNQGPSFEWITFADAKFFDTYSTAVTGQRTAGVMTLTLPNVTLYNKFAVNDWVYVYGTTPTNCDGRFQITSKNSSGGYHLLYNDNRADATMTDCWFRSCPIVESALEVHEYTRSYYRKCMFFGAQSGLRISATASDTADASWSRIDQCSTLLCDVGIDLYGVGNKSTNISGGTYLLGHNQTGIRMYNNVNPDNTTDQHTSIWAGKWDWVGDATGAWGIHHYGGQMFSVDGVQMELDASGGGGIWIENCNASLSNLNLKTNTGTGNTLLKFEDCGAGAQVTNAYLGKGEVLVDVVASDPANSKRCVDVTLANLALGGGGGADYGVRIGTGNINTHLHNVHWVQNNAPGVAFISDNGTDTVVSYSDSRQTGGQRQGGVGTARWSSQPTNAQGFKGEIGIQGGKLWFKDGSVWRYITPDGSV